MALDNAILGQMWRGLADIIERDGRRKRVMTEQEWLACDDPKQLLDYLTGNMPEKLYDRHPSDRKLRLWVEACREATGVQSWARKLDTDGDLRFALNAWASTAGSSYQGDLHGPARCHLLRDIVGNPFRPVEWCCGCGQTVMVKEWRNWFRCCNCGEMQPCMTASDIRALAHAAYDHRDPATGHLDATRLAILADALEEAGCVGEVCGTCDYGKPGQHTPDDGWWISETCKPCNGTGRLPHPLLAHLRSPDDHVRGCWAIDLVLGKD